MKDSNLEPNLATQSNYPYSHLLNLHSPYQEARQVGLSGPLIQEAPPFTLTRAPQRACESTCRSRTQVEISPGIGCFKGIPGFIPNTRKVNSLVSTSQFWRAQAKTTHMAQTSPSKRIRRRNRTLHAHPGILFLIKQINIYIYMYVALPRHAFNPRWSPLPPHHYPLNFPGPGFFGGGEHSHISQTNLEPKTTTSPFRGPFGLLFICRRVKLACAPPPPRSKRTPHSCWRLPFCGGHCGQARASNPKSSVNKSRMERTQISMPEHCIHGHCHMLLVRQGRLNDFLLIVQIYVGNPDL